MKYLKLMFIAIMLFIVTNGQAQVSISVSINPPPPWGYYQVRYYYLPDLEIYYDIQMHMYIYYFGGRWIHRYTLPVQYRGYDVNRGNKVLLTNYRGNTPYFFIKEHRSKYAKSHWSPPRQSVGQTPRNGNHNLNPHSQKERSRNVIQDRGRAGKQGNHNSKNNKGKGGGSNRR